MVNTIRQAMVQRVVQSFIQGWIWAVIAALTLGTVAGQTTITEDAYLKAAVPAGGDYFGWSSAIDGTSVIVGAPYESTGANRSGAAYVFVYDESSTKWEQQGYLKAPVPGAGDGFGWSVDIDGDRAIVGAPFESGKASSAGSAYVFARDASGNWTFETQLSASDWQSGDEFGTSVAIAEDTIVVGAYLEDTAGVDAGAAYVFQYNGGTLAEQAILHPSSTNPSYGSFGASVAVETGTIVVGASNDSSTASYAGAAYVFVPGLTPGAWNQQAYLTASNAGTYDSFGYAVTVSGDKLVVGAPGESSNGSDPADDSLYAAGAAYVFSRSGTAWTQDAYLKSPKVEYGASFGLSVGIDGEALVAGAAMENGSSFWEGAAYVFTNDGSGWAETADLRASNAEAVDQFGTSAGISGTTVVAGAPGESSVVPGDPNDNSGYDAGAAYVLRFEFSGGGSGPTISANPVSLDEAGSATDALIATVGTPVTGLTVTVQSANPSNGITVANLATADDGSVTADLSAVCFATDTNFTLRVTDTGGAFAEAILAVTVTPETVPPQAKVSTSLTSLWPANKAMLPVGLSGGATDNCDPNPTIVVNVYSNEDDEAAPTGGTIYSPDASGAGGDLSLRAERLPNGEGRVYVILVKATDAAGNSDVAATTVIVPKGNGGKWLDAVNALATAALHEVDSTGKQPAGYALIGDAPPSPAGTNPKKKNP